MILTIDLFIKFAGIYIELTWDESFHVQMASKG